MGGPRSKVVEAGRNIFPFVWFSFYYMSFNKNVEFPLYLAISNIIDIFDMFL